MSHLQYSSSLDVKPYSAHLSAVHWAETGEIMSVYVSPGVPTLNILTHGLVLSRNMVPMGCEMSTRIPSSKVTTTRTVIV